MQKNGGFLRFFGVFYGEDSVFCPTFDPMMQKNGGFLRGCGIFLVVSAGCEFAKALLVQAIDTRCCGYDDESVWGGHVVSGKIIACLT